MADHAKEKGQDFPYLILGIQEHNNNLFLFNYVAKTPSIDFLTGQDLFQMSHQAILDRIDQFLENQTAIYLSIDMDCFAVGSAPGVSAIQSLGVDPSPPASPTHCC